MFTEFYEDLKHFFSKETSEVETEAATLEARVKNAAQEIFNYRFSLASGAHGLMELEQSIIKHLKGEPDASNPNA